MSVIRHLPSPVRHEVIRQVGAVLHRWRARRWTPPAPIASLASGPLVVSGFVNEAIGVGRAARMSIRALHRAGLSPVEHDLREALNRYPRGGLSLPGGPCGVWLLHANAPECDIALQVHQPADWAQRYRIGYWAWETTLAPPSWVPVASWLHEIWTPSRFTADALAAAFARAGRADLTARLKVMPHPTPRIFASSDRPGFGLSPGAFVALAFFDGRSAYARKNPLGAVAAWITAFPSESAERLLIVKSVVSAEDPRARRALEQAIGGRSDIRVIEESLTDDAMNSLIASSDLLLSLHRSEGFGLGLAEAMALGKTVLTSAYSAPGEFLDAHCALIIDATEIDVDDPSGAYRQGRWSAPDVADAAAKLRLAASAPDLRARLGEAAVAAVQRLDQPWTPPALARHDWLRLVGR